MNNQPRKDGKIKTIDEYDDDELRRYRRHQQKKRLVRDIWIYAGIVICILPLNLQITGLLATTFLSFMILDETP